MSTTTKKPARIRIPLGDAGLQSIVLQWGRITPGNATVTLTGVGLSAASAYHATPAQLRELAALCVHAADEIESEMKEAG